jgi:hypothetical protein
MAVHFFTPGEANKRIPQVRDLASRIVELKKSLDKLELSELKTRKETSSELGSAIAKLQKMGIELKDMDTGLVDFPALRFGETVYLCWKLGEDEVMFWHTIIEGYAGRKPLNPEMAQIQ